jgi:hypothetical protein
MGLLTLDQRVIPSVIEEWGFGALGLFASATLLRPAQFKKEGAEHEEE